MAWDHRSLEGALYGLGRPPDAQPAQARPVFIPRIERPVPRSVPHGSTRRLELDLVVRRLTPDDRRVLTEHYIEGNRHPYRDRKQIIGRLLAVLNTDDVR